MADEIDDMVAASNHLRVKLFRLARGGVFTAEEYADLLAGLDVVAGVSFGVVRKSDGPRKVDPDAVESFFNTQAI
jgi:hypothetical protein